MLHQSIKLLSALAFLMAVAAASCSDDNEEDLKPDAPQSASCDTATVTFSATAAPILAANCYSCHSSGIAESGVILDTYAGVYEEAHHGHLIGVITHAPGFPPMPQGAAKLSDCDIAKIRKWVDTGAPNN